MSTETDTLLGTVVGGRWRVTRKLGEGGMGAVYAVEGLGGEGDRAVKLLHREFIKEEQVVSRFYAEAEASQRLDHPHIARVFESGQTASGEPFLIMELLRGRPLADVCPEGERLPVDEAVVIIQEVLLALTAAHAQDIVHRDLKPDNVFLCDLPEGGRRAKLLDFGIARVIDAAGGGMRKTRTGMLLGTPGYMSPEQLRNSKSVDPRSDLWSLNTVFYELLSGRDPYGATNDFARLTAVFTQDSIPIDRDLPELAPWREFFVRAFARDINHRFQSAGEMSAAVAAVARGEPMPPPHPPLNPAAPPASVAAPPSAVAPPASNNANIALASTMPAGFQVPGEYATGPTVAMPAVSAEAMQASLAGRQSLPGAPAMVSTPGGVMPVPVGAPMASNPMLQAPAPTANRLVWALIGVVLLLGAVIVFLAVRSMQDENRGGGKGRQADPPAAPAGKPKHK